VGSITFTYTFTGSEVHGATFLTAAIPNWTGLWTLNAALSAPATTIYNFFYTFQKSSTSTACWSDGISFVGGDTSKAVVWTVGVPSGSWHCGDWDTFYFGYGGSTFNAPAGMVLTLTLSGAGIAGGVAACAYGTEKIQPAATVAEFSLGLVQAVLGFQKSRYAIPAIAAIQAGAIDLNQLCDSLPPEPVTIDPGDWFAIATGDYTTAAQQKLYRNWRNALWNFFCR